MLIDAGNNDDNETIINYIKNLSYDTINIDNLNVEILAPVNDTYDELNNYSAVVKVTYGNNSFLFMGDAETLSENEITADLEADMLKVGHHGSDTSTSKEFLSKVKPTYAVISVGKDNSYGHPSNDVLALLDEFDVNVFRTDKQGTIVAQSDGNMILINKEPSPYETNAPSSMKPETPTVVTTIPKVVETAPVVAEGVPTKYNK